MSNLTKRYDPFDELFRGFFVRPVDFGQGREAPELRVDVKENDNAYEVHAELPGVNKEDIHVDIDGAVVAISAERKQEKEIKEGERVLRTERYFGKVSRSFQLAQEIDENQTVARYNNGVLELTLPKKTAVQARRITIQ
ncbi:Heat-shock protein Hsp20 [Georgfuchsia toluolica]|uniref:Heat-shock protein Hsp20 n=1 Tax=Georgfuchsia toluolica TaxID=424218 RepID=A0A916N2T8_9PROT|nr:Hsp20/alpha crystallin family protein [Georgfuchsia toluolica]CAG4884274.1 Heat-shock protein Hsp20 [Georgfuchsia toluolica]